MYKRQVPDQRLGQAVTLLLADQPDTEEIGNKLHEILEPYYRPKHILTIESICLLYTPRCV